MAEKTGAGDAPPSKLERLLRLLHEGGSRHVRELAGERIAGLIHASQGQNILNLLNKVKPLLYDRRRLDTRLARPAECILLYWVPPDSVVGGAKRPGLPLDSTAFAAGRRLRAAGVEGAGG